MKGRGDEEDDEEEEKEEESDVQCLTLSTSTSPPHPHPHPPLVLQQGADSLAIKHQLSAYIIRQSNSPRSVYLISPKFCQSVDMCISK